MADPELGTSMYIKPAQMALLKLGYTVDMVIEGDTTTLELEVPGSFITFKIDEVTHALEVTYTWGGYVPADQVHHSLDTLLSVRSRILEPQIVLVERENGDALVRGRLFLFAGAGVTWDQTAEFVYYSMTDALREFMDLCASLWPDTAPDPQPLPEHDRSELPKGFGDKWAVDQNPYGLVPGTAEEVTFERIHELLIAMEHPEFDAITLHPDHSVEFDFQGQRVCVLLPNGKDGSSRQTLIVSSGTGMSIEDQEQADRLAWLCNDVTCAHSMTTVFAEDIEGGARTGIFSESRFEVSAGLTDVQLVHILVNTAGWNAELCLTVRFKI